MRFLIGALVALPLLVAAQTPSPLAGAASDFVEETIELPSLPSKILVRYPAAIEPQFLSHFDPYVEFTLLSGAKPVFVTSDNLFWQASPEAPEWHGGGFEVPVLEVGKQVTARTWAALSEPVRNGQMRCKFRFWDLAQRKRAPEGYFDLSHADRIEIRRTGEKGARLILEHPIIISLRPTPAKAPEK